MLVCVAALGSVRHVGGLAAIHGLGALLSPVIAAAEENSSSSQKDQSGKSKTTPATVRPTAAADTGAKTSAGTDAGAGTKPAGPANAATIKLVKFFIDNEVADLPPDRIPEFIAVDPKTLPAKLRDRFQARRIDLLGRKKIADGKKKPPVRRVGLEALNTPSCAEPTWLSDPGILKGFGFMEIAESEEIWLIQETKCNECELITEFSLTIAAKPVPQGKKDRSRLRYFLKDADPLTVLIQAHREGREAFGTNFFGIGHPSCR